MWNYDCSTHRKQLSSDAKNKHSKKTAESRGCYLFGTDDRLFFPNGLLSRLYVILPQELKRISVVLRQVVTGYW